jgi:hypothetical protein
MFSVAPVTTKLYNILINKYVQYTCIKHNKVRNEAKKVFAI